MRTMPSRTLKRARPCGTSRRRTNALSGESSTGRAIAPSILSTRTGCGRTICTWCRKGRARRQAVRQAARAPGTGRKHPSAASASPVSYKLASPKAFPTLMTMAAPFPVGRSRSRRKSHGEAGDADGTFGYGEGKSLPSFPKLKTMPRSPLARLISKKACLALASGISSLSRAVVKPRASLMRGSAVHGRRRALLTGGPIRVV